MAAEWSITASADEVALDANGEAEVEFVVHNRGDSASDAVVHIIGSPAARGCSFAIEQRNRTIALNESATFLARIVASDRATPGRYFFQARVHAADAGPEDGFTMSYRIPLIIPAGPGRRPAEVTVPSVLGQTLDSASMLLYQADLLPRLPANVALLLATASLGDDVPNYIVRDQRPAAGASVAAGSEVALDVQVEYVEELGQEVNLGEKDEPRYPVYRDPFCDVYPDSCSGMAGSEDLGTIPAFDLRYRWLA